MGNRQVKYAYVSFYTPFGKGYGCFAYNWVDVRTENVCEVGISFYSPFEQKRFDKKTGRVLAAGRLIVNPTKVDIDPEKEDSIHYQIIQQVLDNCDIPSWAEKAWEDLMYTVGLNHDIKFEDFIKCNTDDEVMAEYYIKMYRLVKDDIAFAQMIASKVK